MNPEPSLPSKTPDPDRFEPDRHNFDRGGEPCIARLSGACQSTLQAKRGDQTQGQQADPAGRIPLRVA